MLYERCTPCRRPACFHAPPSSNASLYHSLINRKQFNNKQLYHANITHRRTGSSAVLQNVPPAIQTSKNLAMLARKKYSDEQLKMQCLILKRTVLRFDQGQVSEDKFIRELLKMDVLAENGLYVKPIIKPSWMVPYITAFPLDEDDAADAFVDKVIQTRREQRKALESARTADSAPSMSNVVSKMHTLLHQHPSKIHRWLKLDVDTKDPRLVQQLQEVIKGAKIIFATESRGGYHVILEKGSFCQSLYRFAAAVNRDCAKEDQWITIENNSGPLLAIPGTNQGGFVVKDATEMWQSSVRES